MIPARTTKKQDNGNIVEKGKNFGFNVISLEEMNLALLKRTPPPRCVCNKSLPNDAPSVKVQSYDNHSSRLLTVVSATGL